ncbi:hypothetical protein ACIBO1_16705 [Micromonospora sp. NPDC049903]|uniref:hypothetical protein n=1 Tax=Micromonospora sp. NPDC049903 TaxID=3364276 RepID=UPI003793253A
MQPTDGTPLEVTLDALARRGGPRADQARRALDELGRALAAAAHWPPPGDDADRETGRLIGDVLRRLWAAAGPAPTAAEPTVGAPRTGDTEPSVPASRSPAAAASTSGSVPAGGPGRGRPVLAAEVDALVAQFLADDELAAWRDAAPPSDPAHCWEWMWLTCLGFPDRQATRWRGRLARLGEGVAGPPGALVPALPGVGSAGLDLPCAEPDAEVFAALHAREDDLARLVTDVLSLAGSRASLDHSLHPARAGKHRLDEEGQQRHYREHLLRRLREYADERDQGGRLRRLVVVDEAVRSLFPRPLPAPGSWWRRFAERSDVLLRDRFAGHDAEITVPAGPYPPCWPRNSKKSTSPNLDMKVASDQTKRRHHVEWVLRVAYRVGENTLDGRVIYTE